MSEAPGGAAPAPVGDDIAALFAGERAALARAITAVENETPDAAAVLAAIRPRLGRALVVGFTGAPGAGKSTLVAAYIAELRKRGLRVGVVAVDPSSPISVGALLGDRIRRLLANLVAEAARRQIGEQASAEIDALCEALLKGEIGFDAAVRAALGRLGKP